MIASEKGLVHTRNHLDMEISPSDYNFNLLQDKEIFQDMKNFQDIEGLVLNCVEILLENQDTKNLQDQEIFQDKEYKHHTQYIVQPSE